MKSVTGFVELSAGDALIKSEQTLQWIQEKRKEFKNKLVFGFIKEENKRNWIQKLFKVSAPNYTYESAIQEMDKRSLNDFCGCSVRAIVDNQHSNLEIEAMKIRKAATMSETVLVSIDVACRLQSV